MKCPYWDRCVRRGTHWCKRCRHYWGKKDYFEPDHKWVPIPKDPWKPVKTPWDRPWRCELGVRA